MRTTVLTAALLAGAALPAFAQEHPAEASGGLMTPAGGLMIWTLIIFVILLFILSKYAFGPITAAVEAREKALEDAIAGAAKDRDEAAKMLAEQRAQVEATRLETQRIIADGRAAGEKLRHQMLEETRQQQQELLERARREMESDKVKAVRELRREAVELAISGASKIIERNLDDQANRRIVEEYLASLSLPAAR